VIAWAHDLSGMARQCAPSLTRNLNRGPLLSMYVSLGYAVVASDYTGLGTDYRNAFRDIESNARTQDRNAEGNPYHSPLSSRV